MAEKCLALHALLMGSAFGAIDLARVDDGLFTRFFEINPNGQWAWI